MTPPNNDKSNIVGEQQKKSKVPPQLQPHVYKKGQSGNPSGRPKGAVSLKEYIRRKLEKMTDEEREEYLDGIDKKTIWEMAEGKPKQDTDVTSNGESIQPLLVKIIGKDEDNTAS